ncbi:MAG: PqqD family peptide modification chaperone [Pseudomonadota bacterium]
MANSGSPHASDADSQNAISLPFKSTETHVIGSGDEHIVFHRILQQYFLFNPTAVEIWEQAKHTNSLESLAVNLAREFKVKPEVLLPDIRGIFTQWSQAGLLSDDSSKPTQESDEVLPGPIHSSGAHISKFKIQEFRLIDSNYLISSSNAEIISLLTPLFSHLPKTNGSNELHHIQIDEIDGVFTVIESGQRFGQSSELEEMVPIVNAHVMVSAYQHVECLSVFHAGALSDGKSVIMFSAPSGHGKSTLTAALASTDLHLYSDEVVVLKPNARIRAAPACFGLKTGSWQSLTRYWPDLMKIPEYRRQDDKQVRLLAPPALESEVDTPDGLPLRAIVFPRYDPKGKTNTAPVTPAQALVRLTDAGYHTNTPLTFDAAERLVRIIENVPAIDLTVNDLDESIEVIQALFRST